MFTHNKWSVLMGAIIAQLCVGTIYSWSLYNYPLMNKYGYTEQEVVLTFSIATFMFALATIVSGKLQDRIGPRIVATVGGLLYGGGLILSAFVTNISVLYLTYGVVSGIGVGFVYVCPITTCVKWFNNQKGLITGISVGAFGLGSFMFKFIIQALLESIGISDTMLVIGIIYLVLIVVASHFLVLPKEDADHKDTNLEKEHSYTVKEMLKTSDFYLLWVVFLFGCISGLLVIGLAKDIGISEAGLTEHKAANAVALIALFNAGGRLMWGYLSDYLGRLHVLLIMFIITAVSMALLSVLSLNLILFFTLVALIAFCFGGFLAVFPTITGEFFGSKHLGSNYGVMYQAYGVAALTGSLIQGSVTSLNSAFIVSALIAIAGGFLTFFITKIRASHQLTQIG